MFWEGISWGSVACLPANTPAPSTSFAVQPQLRIIHRNFKMTSRASTCCPLRLLVFTPTLQPCSEFLLAKCLRCRLLARARPLVAGKGDLCWLRRSFKPQNCGDALAPFGWTLRILYFFLVSFGPAYSQIRLVGSHCSRPACDQRFWHQHPLRSVYHVGSTITERQRGSSLLAAIKRPSVSMVRTDHNLRILL